ncbi:hypothetical protein Tco_1238794 [Tanacetum coccineum]
MLNGSDALTEVLNPDNLNYDLFNKSEQIITSSEQSNDVSQSETEITSDSNIIPYSRYLSEAQQEKSLTTELDRYKEEVKYLKEMQNAENSFSGSNEQYAEIAVEQHRLESRTFEVKMNQVLSENERLLAQAIDMILLRCCEFVRDAKTYDKLCKSFTTLEKHCITLEADSQLNQEIFQQENSVLNQNAPSFTQLFELSELRAQSQGKDTSHCHVEEHIKP